LTKRSAPHRARVVDALRQSRRAFFSAEAKVVEHIVDPDEESDRGWRALDEVPDVEEQQDHDAEAKKRLVVLPASARKKQGGPNCERRIHGKDVVGDGHLQLPSVVTTVTLQPEMDLRHDRGRSAGTGPALWRSNRASRTDSRGAAQNRPRIAPARFIARATAFSMFIADGGPYMIHTGPGWRMNFRGIEQVDSMVKNVRAVELLLDPTDLVGDDERRPGSLLVAGTSLWNIALGNRFDGSPDLRFDGNGRRTECSSTTEGVAKSMRSSVTCWRCPSRACPIG